MPFFAAQEARMPYASPRILLVDDDRDFLEGLTEWLESFDYQVWVATDGHGAMALLRREKVDVVVTDLKMPKLNGLDLLGLVKGLDPRIEVIFLTGQGSMDDAILALREGRAFDFLKKPLEDPQQLNLAIEKALSRQLRLPDEAREAAADLVDPALQRLSPRERDILVRILKGLQHRQIGEELGLTEKTVRNYLSVIYEKLGVSNLPQTILYCLKHGLLPPS